MNRNWLEIVFPAALALLVCTIGVFLLSMAGLLGAAPTAPLAAAGPATTSADSTQVAPPNAPPLTAEQTAAITAGETLFAGNCAQCHDVNSVVVGPALAGIHKRRSEKWLLAWVKNSSKLIASGDAQAVQVFNQFQKQQMPSFQLSDQEIKFILAYLEAESNSGMAYAPTVALAN